MVRKVDLNKLMGKGSSAALIEHEASVPEVATTGPKVKQKRIPNLPCSYEDRYKALKDKGGTSLMFTAYILEALREKLERDEHNG